MGWCSDGEPVHGGDPHTAPLSRRHCPRGRCGLPASPRWFIHICMMPAWGCVHAGVCTGACQPSQWQHHAESRWQLHQLLSKHVCSSSCEMDGPLMIPMSHLWRLLHDRPDGAVHDCVRLLPAHLPPAQAGSPHSLGLPHPLPPTSLLYCICLPAQELLHGMPGVKGRLFGFTIPHVCKPSEVCTCHAMAATTTGMSNDCVLAGLLSLRDV